MSAIQDGYLTRYIEQNNLFVKTVVIKLKEAAELINEGVVARSGQVVDTTDPTTWKYYLNLSGQYHPTDTPMTVVSIDTLETIEFTRENLAVHTATAAAHKYGTRHYYALVRRYPQQEGLINGILLPVEMDAAIAAENGTILAYRTDLVELNEVSLIPELESYIKRVMARWFNVQFAMSDDLYVADFFNKLHLFLVPKLIEHRASRMKTAEAHSFHVRMYLASHQRLDRFLPYLNLKQALWLYRNIAYLERNPGKMKTFLTLVERILTERGIPLGEYTVRQLDDFDGYVPKQIARIRLLNDNVNTLSSDFHSVEGLFEKELNMAPGNQNYFLAEQENDLQRLSTHSSAVTQTKVLHSSMVDYSNAVPEPFEEVALRQWCYLANNGLYNVSVSFKDPTTSQTYTLFAKDAFLYMYYVSLKSEGYNPVEIPEYLNMQQRRHPKPSLSDLLSVVPTQEHDLAAIAQAVLTRQPNIVPILSVSAFYDHAEWLTNEAYWHWFLISSVQDLYERALVENLIKRLYEDVRMQIDVGTPHFGTWLAQNNLPTYDMSRDEALLLIRAIFEAATGLAVDNARMLRNIQKALIELVTVLSSYSIQLTREINSEDIIAINWPAIRFGNQRMSQSTIRNIDNGSEVLTFNAHGYEYAHVGTDLETVAQTKVSETTYQRHVELDASVTSTLSARGRTSATNTFSGIELDVTWAGANAALEQEMGLVGYTTFDQLPEDFRRQLKFKSF